MITQIDIRNFKSLGPDFRLDLTRDPKGIFEREGLTVLVGPNGSGKSNIADAFQFLSEAIMTGLENAIERRRGIRSIRRRSSEGHLDVGFSVAWMSSRRKAEYSFTLASRGDDDYFVKEERGNTVEIPEGRTPRFHLQDGTWLDGPRNLRPQVSCRALALPLLLGDKRFAPIAEAFGSSSVYSIRPEILRTPQRSDPRLPMQSHGENWMSVLRNPNNAGATAELKAALARLTGDIMDFRISLMGGHLGAEFLHRHGTPSLALNDSPSSGQWFDSSLESDGTLRVAGILTALLQNPLPGLVAIEEPELSVHPGAIPLLYDYLEQAARRSQVLVTTHSVELLDRIDVDRIRVVERRAGVTTVGRVTEEQREAVRSRLLKISDLVGMEGGLRQQSSRPEFPQSGTSGASSET